MFDIRDAISLLNAELTRANQYWSFYSLVALAAISYTVTKDPSAMTVGARLGLSLAFSVFAAINATVLYKSAQLTFILAKAAQAAASSDDFPQTYRASMDVLPVSRANHVASAHLLLDAAVVLGMWTPVVLRDVG